MVCVMESMKILFVRSTSQPSPTCPSSPCIKNTAGFPISRGVLFYIPLFFYHMTSYFMSRFHLSEDRCFLSAFFCRMRTTCRESHNPLKSSVLTGCSPESSENPSLSIYGSGTEAKSPLVYGWSGFANNSYGIGFFYQCPQIHSPNTV